MKSELLPSFQYHSHRVNKFVTDEIM